VPGFLLRHEYTARGPGLHTHARRSVRLTKFKKLRKSHRGTNFETNLKAYLAIATSRPTLKPCGSSQRQKGVRSDLRSLENFVSLIQVISTMSFRTSCFGTAQGARRKPKRHARQGIQVFSSPPAPHALPARRNDSFLLSRSRSRKIIKARQALPKYFPKRKFKADRRFAFWGPI